MDDGVQEKAEEETRLRVLLVEEIIGLRSRWSGRIVWEDTAMQVQRGRRVLGEKRWNCDILMHVDLCNKPRRWRTLLHELLHSVSAGMNEPDYQRFRGWEEGTVEWLQRRHRPEILHSLGINVPAEVFADVEDHWAMNSYLEALQVLQEACGLDEDEFYRELLRTPLALRPAAVRAWGGQTSFLSLFARTIGKLR